MSVANTSTSLRITCNGEPHSVAPGTTVAALLEQLSMEPRHVAVECNLELVPRTRHAQHVLADGDRLEIVTLVGGG
jgi:sulfur carrier protein